MQSKVLGMVSVMLANPNCKTIVIDLQLEEPAYLMCFSLTWNELRARIEAKEVLTKHMLAGGPVD